MHKFKKRLTGKKEEAADPQFEAALTNFDKLSTQVLCCQKQMGDFSTKIRAICAASGAVVDQFDSFILKSDRGHYCGDTMTQSKKQTDILTITLSKKVQKQLESTCIPRLDKLVEKVTSIRESLAKRKEIRDEKVYYSTKVDKLNKNKNKESDKDRERRERNEQKANELQQTFQTINSSLTQDMEELWKTRLDRLAPILENFVKVQQTFSSGYADCMQKIPLMDPNATSSVPPPAAEEDEVENLDDFLGNDDAEEKATEKAAEVSEPGAEQELVFVRALFDLKTEDPDNLEFEEGDVIKVLTADVDWDEGSADAWLSGQVMHSSDDRVGQFPRKWVELIVDGEDGAAEESAVEGAGLSLRALFDLETDDPDNLRFVEGDILTLLSTKAEWEDDDVQWLNGKLEKDGSLGQFPKNYVELA